MSKLICYDTEGNVVSEMYQWDVNRIIEIAGAKTSPLPKVHFANRYSKQALVVTPEINDSRLVVTVPALLLQESETIIVYLYYTSSGDEDASSESIEAFYIPVIPRPMPSAYEYDGSGDATTVPTIFDGGYVDSSGYLHLTLGGVDIDNFDPILLPSGGGGGGGNNAVLSVANTTGWLSKSIASGSECVLSLTWSSLEDDISTGNGTMKVTVNGSIKSATEVTQGSVSKDVSGYLSSGTNTVKLTISDTYDNTRTITYTINVVAISISSSFDSSVTYSSDITFPYTPVGSVSKTVYFVVDDTVVGTTETTSSGRQLTYIFGQLSHGSHSLRVYFESVIDDSTVRSNELYYDIIFVESGNTNPIISSEFTTTEVSQYETISIPYRVYDPSTLYADATIYVNGEEVSTLSVDRTVQTYSYKAIESGSLSIEIVCGTASKTFNITVNAVDIDVEPETNNIELYLTSTGRSNSELNPEIWEYNDVSATLTNFNFVSDGWVSDDDGNTVLRITGDDTVYIPFEIFSGDFRTSGKTIEFEFETKDIRNYDAEVISCYSGGRGFTLTAQKAFLASEQSSIFTQYKEDEHVRISFVIEKKSNNRLIFIYINGIASGVVQYPEDDNFAQANPVGITIGSTECTVDIYNIRIYNNDLTRHQILRNWIGDTQDIELMFERYNHNNVFDAYSKIVIAQLPTDLPYMILKVTDEARNDQLPQYKGDKMTVSGSFTDPSGEHPNFTFEGAQANVQGTSSQYYARKNYKIKYKKGFVLDDGSTVSKYQIRDDSIGVNEFCFKADVASSEGANNVELVRLYDDICPWQTPYQEANDAVRQGIDGFPIVIFQELSDGTVNFIGKYNFNNDKGNEDVFGFQDGDESWEVKNNTSDRVNWKSDDFTSTTVDDSGNTIFEWENDFEARFPDTDPAYTDTTKLAELATWLKSTDQTAVDTDEEKAARLQKFIDEFDTYLEKDAITFYYLFTEVFLMVDSRAKNAFFTHMDDSNWFSLPYDFDTALGINNEGSLVFGYGLEDIDKTESGANVFNGQDSVLWVNFRQAFYSDIQSMYRTLRSSGKFSYDYVENRFEEHQDKWPEAIFNEDAYFKYLEPLINDNDSTYLPMLQGSKTEQRKWWLYNRFKYLDSKYNAGDAQSDRIQLRSYAKSDITLTPYADIYAAIMWGQTYTSVRAEKNNSYTIECPLTTLNDTETYIYSASQIADVGDLSGLMVGLADFSKAVKLQNLKLGDSSDGYSNSNLTSLTFANNTLLRTVDVRNCPNLTQAVDLSGCTNIEEAYFEGTSVTAVKVPNGGVLTTLHLPETITNLTIRNQASLIDFQIPIYENITTLWLENVSGVFDYYEIMQQIQAGSRVRLIGFYIECESIEELINFVSLIDTFSGLDEDGNNVENAQVSGTLHISQAYHMILDDLRTNYPTLTIICDDERYMARDFVSGYLTQLVDEKITSLPASQFENNNKIKTVILPNCTSAGYNVFRYSYGLQYLELPNLTYIPNTFCQGATALTTVKLPAATGGGYIAFEGCTKLTEINLPMFTGAIPSRFATGCSKLTKVVMPKATSINSTKAFTSCPKLSLVDFTDMATIATTTFTNDSSLTTMILRKTDSITTLANVAAFTGTPLAANGSGGTVYVPNDLIDAYKTATNWSTLYDAGSVTFAAIEGSEYE